MKNEKHETRKRKLKQLLRKYSSHDSAGAVWGMKPQQISHILNGVRNMGETIASRIENAERLPAGWMSNNEAKEQPELYSIGKGNIGDVVVGPSDTDVEITQWEATMTGSVNQTGSINDDAYIKGRLSFKQSWLDRRGFKAENLLTVYVRGNSMAPRIVEGDTVVINKDYRAILNGKVYAFVIDGEAFLKCIIKNPNGTITLRSYNTSESPDWNLSADEMNDMNIIGQVVQLAGEI